MCPQGLVAMTFEADDDRGLVCTLDNMNRYRRALRQGSNDNDNDPETVVVKDDGRWILRDSGSHHHLHSMALRPQLKTSWSEEVTEALWLTVNKQLLSPKEFFLKPLWL